MYVAILFIVIHFWMRTSRCAHSQWGIFGSNLFLFAVVPVNVLYSQSAMHLVGRPPKTDVIFYVFQRLWNQWVPLRARQPPSIACLNSDCSTVVELGEGNGQIRRVGMKCHCLNVEKKWNCSTFLVLMRAKKWKWVKKRVVFRILCCHENDVWANLNYFNLQGYYFYIYYWLV